MSPSDRLAVLPFLQSWTGSQLQLRVLLIPRDNFIEPYVRSNPQSPDCFPGATLEFDVFIRSGLETLPLRGAGTLQKTETFQSLDDAVDIFKELLHQEDPIPTPAARDPGAESNDLRVRKHLPLSYQTTAGYSPGEGKAADLFSTDNSYSCALKQMARPITYKKIILPKKTSWGQLVSGLLRNARFAEYAGLVRNVTVDIPAEQLDLVRNGGFLYLTPHEGSIAATGGCEVYAARIPVLTETQRELFTPVLFPVVEPLPGGGLPPDEALSGNDYDDMFAEAEDYNDGWAKLVHCRQPQRASVVKEEDGDPEELAGSRPVKEMGIQVGWDDQQVTIWMDRQMDSRNDKLRTSLGIKGYCVDARFAGDANDWQSLVKAKGSYGVGHFHKDDFDGEMPVEVCPTASINKSTAPPSPPKFWMPMYFTTWTGPALVGLDTSRMVTSGRPEDSPNRQPYRLEGIPPSNLPLIYGKDYEFRVRLMDQTGWGPDLKSRPTNPATHPVFNIPFRRWIRPLAPTLVNNMPTLGEEQDDRAPLSVSFKRPGFQYPAIQCTGDADAARRLMDLIGADGTIEPSLPDPDVNRLEVIVQVKTLTQDTLVTEGSFRHLYTTNRAFSSDVDASLDLTFTWISCHDVDHPDPSRPNDTDPWQSGVLSGPLRLPMSRTVRVCVRALCKEDPALSYFGAGDVRRGPEVKLALRKNAATETALFADTSTTERFNAHFLQPDLSVPSLDVAVSALPTPISRLAAEVGLRHDGNILRSPPGRRLVFACSAGLRHAIGPDGASLNITGTVAQLWVIVIKLTVDRDWTWDGLVHNSIVVRRSIDTNELAPTSPTTPIEVIKFSPSHNVNGDALTGPDIIRSTTELVMIDAFDPLQITTTSGFPEEIYAKYTVNWRTVSSAANEPLTFPIRLPVTTPPTQTPRIVSAGIALSPYSASSTYSSTSPRSRMLWIELAEPPRDPGDHYFARVLAHAPDPMLQNPNLPGPPVSAEPALPIDPEPLRRITAANSDDRAGLDAMQPLVPSTHSEGGEGTLHWGLPLPPGVSEDSEELFGLWTYEIRVGHYSSTRVSPESSIKPGGRWCTAQSRFGPPLRVAGVQHPAPPLACSAYRPGATAPGIMVEATATLATVAYKWQPTSLWFMLYAQAELLDGNGQRRNVLLLRRHAEYVDIPSRAHLAGLFGIGRFKTADVQEALTALGFESGAPLSVLAAEMFQGEVEAERTDPLGYGLGSVRILRTSPLVEVKGHC